MILNRNSSFLFFCFVCCLFFFLRYYSQERRVTRKKRSPLRFFVFVFCFFFRSLVFAPFPQAEYLEHATPVPPFRRSRPCLDKCRANLVPRVLSCPPSGKNHANEVRRQWKKNTFVKSKLRTLQTAIYLPEKQNLSPLRTNHLLSYACV